MTAEKEPVDLRKIDPVVTGEDRDAAQRGAPPGAERDAEPEMTETAATAAAGTTPAVGLIADDEDEEPQDPDELDRLRRG